MRPNLCSDFFEAIMKVAAKAAPAALSIQGASATAAQPRSIVRNARQDPTPPRSDASSKGQSPAARS